MSQVSQSSIEQIEQLRHQLRQSAQRLERLETDVEREALVIIQSQSDEMIFTEEFSKSVKDVSSQHQLLQEELKSFFRSVGVLSSRMRSVVKKEQLSSLQSGIDDWSLEELIPRNEFEALVEQRFS